MDTVNVINKMIDKNVVMEHAQRLYDLLNALVFCKKALSLTWFLGNVSIIVLLTLGILLYIAANSSFKIKGLKRAQLSTITLYGFAVVYLICAVLAKVLSGNLVVILVTMIFGLAAFVFWKWEFLFSIKKGKTLPFGFLIMLIAVGIIQLFVFNTFPQLIKVDEHANNFLHSVNSDMLNDNILSENE